MGIHHPLKVLFERQRFVATIRLTFPRPLGTTFAEVVYPHTKSPSYPVLRKYTVCVIAPG